MRSLVYNIGQFDIFNKIGDPTGSIGVESDVVRLIFDSEAT